MWNFILYLFGAVLIASLAISLLPIVIAVGLIYWVYKSLTNSVDNMYKDKPTHQPINHKNPKPLFRMVDVNTNKKEVVDDLIYEIRKYIRQRDYQENYYTYALNNISNMFDKGQDFEYFCAEVLRRNGFENVHVTPYSNDYGVDVTAETKDHVKYAFQCKCYSTPLGNTPIQEVNAGRSYYDCHVSVVITNSTFTNNATELASVNNVLLWDKNKLNELIKVANKERYNELYRNETNPL